VLAEHEVDRTLAFLRELRRAAGARGQTKLFIAPVEDLR
jgi:hypothetical protein